MNKAQLAYIIGVAIGDGNLSNPNGRAVRLRVTCDIKYPAIIKNVTEAIREIMPNNKVSTISRLKNNCLDVSCYSNKWEGLLGWKASNGSKHNQHVRIPGWIKLKKSFIINCLRGLIETDGSIYFDRQYKMVNFTTVIPELSNDVCEMITKLGFKPNLQTVQIKDKKTRYNIRVSKNSEEFIRVLGIDKK